MVQKSLRKRELFLLYNLICSKSKIQIVLIFREKGKKKRKFIECSRDAIMNLALDVYLALEDRTFFTIMRIPATFIFMALSLTMR